MNATIKPPARRARVGRLVALLRPHTGRWALATAALLLAASVNLALPQAVRLAIDDAVGRGDRELLAWICVGALLGFAALAALTFLRSYLMAWLGGRVVAELRRETFEHLLTHPPGFFQERSSGELISRLTSDIGMLHHAVGAELSIALRSSLTVVGGLVLLLATSPGLTLMMVALMPPVALGAVWVGKHVRRRSREVQDQVAEANAGLKEALTGIETVQTFTAEAREAQRYGGRVFKAFRTDLRVALLRSGLMAGVLFGGYAALAVILWVGAGQVMDKALSAGELATFLLYTIMVTGALAGLADIWSNLQRAVGASGRIFELLETRPIIASTAGAEALREVRGEIAFEDVAFAYPSRPDVTVLHDVSLAAKSGEVVALVGQSGAGKSTLTLLLQRFYDPVAGRILVDGKDVRGVQLEDLRAAIATVSQDPVLFSGSVRENILYGRPGATEEEVRQAAADAYIAEFVEGLPDGYETVVGERGVKLSGGQRQRVAIARAMLANPRILILDEATSHLDSENEALVHEALARLMTARTTLVIAHRLSTVRNADRIVVMDEGRVVEVGTHDELMAVGEIYPRLTSNQAILS